MSSLSLRRHPTHQAIALVLAILLMGLPFQLQAQGLGRLFLTPAERAYLENLREQSLAPKPQRQEIVVPVVEEPVQAEEEETVYRHGGAMRRSDGSYTIWLNGQPMSARDLPDNVELLPPFSQGRLRITDPDSGRGFELSPGQILNLTLGEVLESYQFVPVPQSSAGAAGAQP